MGKIAGPIYGNRTVPYSQRYLFNAIPDTNHDANPTNSNRNSKGNPNPTKPTNPNTRYRCKYGTLNSMFAYNFTNYGVFSCGSGKHVHVPYVLCPLRETRYICLTTLYRKHKV